MDKPKVVDYNTTDTAKAYFAKLNEEYYKGILDPDFAVQNYDEYINKLCTGRVLGMCDQCWDFQYNVEPAFRVSYSLNDGTDASLSDYGCDYVPLGLVIDGKLDQQYHTYGEMIDYSSGIAVTVGCYDPDKAFGFLNDLLSQDIHDLRFWGIEGVDYLVDKNGLYYRTPEMTEKWNDYSYMAAHTCEYSYMPSWKGISDDGKNRMIPSEQPSIFREQLSDPVNKCFDAYGVENYVEFIGSKYVKPEPWYPMWSWSNNLDSSSVVGRAFMQMGECKKQWIPKLVLSANFEATWSDYMNVYTVTNPDLFLDAAQKEVEYRLNN